MNTTATKIKPDDYFSTSWGYDQTNIDYLVVKRLSPTGKTAVCRMASKIYINHGGPYGNTVMPGTAFGPEFQMRVTSWYNGRPALRGSYPFCAQVDDRRHDDSRRLDTFETVKLGETRNETDSMFGH